MSRGSAAAAALQKTVAAVSPDALVNFLPIATENSSAIPGDDDELSAARVKPVTLSPTQQTVKVPESVIRTAQAVSNARGVPVSDRQRPAAQQARIGVPTQREVQVAETRLYVDLPEAEFTYIDRPWAHFVTRWAAIDMELERMFRGDKRFTLLDLGSCCGFFSLQAAAGFAEAQVVGIEGSVGIGNGTTGVGGSEDQIIATKAVQTHMSWINQLGLSNCGVAPETWSYQRVSELSALGTPICDVLLSLSVVHHIDNFSADQYAAAGLVNVDGTVSLLAKLLLLASAHFIELPDKPWIEHMHKFYGSPRAILEAAALASGKEWVFTGPLCVLEWYGIRELWLLEDRQAAAPIPWAGLKSLFPRIIGQNSGTQQSSQQPQQHLAQQAVQQAPRSAPRNVPGVPMSDVRAAGVAAAQQLAAAAAVAGRRPIVHAVPPTGPAPMAPSHLGAVRPEELGAALLAAPTALIAAHVQLREAVSAAEGLLHEHQRTAT